MDSDHSLVNVPLDLKEMSIDWSGGIAERVSLIGTQALIVYLYKTCCQLTLGGTGNGENQTILKVTSDQISS
jgi:hypothetical protein